MKVALVVHGRFHAFDLARALLARGHDVRVFTNYPVWAAARFDLPPAGVRSFPFHGGLTRAVDKTTLKVAEWCEPLTHRMFGRWAARMLTRERWDAIHCWSGISEEILQPAVTRGALTLLMRGSAHIATQRRLLDEEAARASVRIDRPSDWMMARERREYERCDVITVLSTFAHRTFVDEGVPAARLQILSLGVDVDAFRCSAADVAARVERIRSGRPLRILYTGALSYQKGLLDLVRAAALVDANRFEFQLVGPIRDEVKPLLKDAAHVVATGKVNQRALPAVYREADLFVFPTIQDGFGMVLAQAKAAGLPIVTTANGAGSDLVQEPENGWIVPIRDPESIAGRLAWCDAHRDALAAMAASPARTRSRSWSEVAADFEHICATHWPIPLRGQSA